MHTPVGECQVLACSPKAASKVFEQAAEEDPIANARVVNCISVVGGGLADVAGIELGKRCLILSRYYLNYPY
jgi:hypothetical protein